MTPEMLAVRRRLYKDYEFYAANALKIRTKEGKIEQLQLNRAQRRMIEMINRQREENGNRVRAIILKARQMGLSTAVGGRMYWSTSQNKARKAIVVTHHADSTKALFDMTRRFHEQCPEILKPSTRYSSRRELSFDLLDSAYMVATAGGDGIGRGETITDAHLSELAFWPRSTAEANFNGLLQAIPNSPGTSVYIESTGNGVSGLFYDQWQQAVKGQNGFVPIFLPWFIQPEYVEVVPPGFERTPEEIELAVLAKVDWDIDLTDAQLMFRRRKIAQNGIDLFRQEYPAAADEAFLTSGRPVFNPDQIAEMLKNAPPPIAQMALEGEDFYAHPRGELKCYLPHDPQGTYYIGVDVGGGVKRDWSVAQVFDERGRQAAVWRGQIEPDAFATTLLHLGNFFNEARIIVESNNHGILPCTRLAKDFAYPNFYTDEVYDKLSDKMTERLGFNTNVRTKPLIIDKLRATLRNREIEIYDRDTLEEMRSFIVTESGSMEAEDGTFDDCVMALALVNHINEGAFAPVENRDEWYVTMV